MKTSNFDVPKIGEPTQSDCLFGGTELTTVLSFIAGMLVAFLVGVLVGVLLSQPTDQEGIDDDDVI